MSESFESVAMSVCRVTADADIRLLHRDADGKVLGSLEAIEDELLPGEQLRFAMNAGMYHKDRSAVGLYVENGVEYSALSVKKGPGNFHMLPNGVFVLTRGEDGSQMAHVMSGDDYQKLNTSIWGATQSGPMLVIDGQLHPSFLPGGRSTKIRNGVGETADGIVFVKSEDPVNFHTFARYFRDELGADTALYLDGTVSQLLSDELGRTGGKYRLGPMVAVIE